MMPSPPTTGGTKSVAEIRKDPVNQHWVIVSEERSRRPSDFARAENAPVPKRWEETCPFCPGNEGKTPPEVFRSASAESSWQVRVVPNKYPILSDEACPQSDATFLEKRAGSGANEVIIETPLHHVRMSEYPLEHLMAVVEAYAQRIEHHLAKPKTACIQLFKNDGKAAGASLAHPHAQLVALPLVPPVIANELATTRQFQQRRKENLFAALIEEELAQSDRVVHVTEDFVLIAPYASRFPYELHLYPRFASSQFTEMTSKQRQGFCQTFRQALRCLDNALDCPPFNWYLHTLPNPASLEDPAHAAVHYRWHIEIIPRLNVWAGLEMGSGMILNPVLPEKAAHALRQVVALSTAPNAHP